MSHRCPSLDESYIAAPLAVFVTIGNTVKLHSKRLYSRAHEDDAERAVRAGLAVIEVVGRLPAREDLRVRLGIATGLAVVGDLIGEGAAQERGVVGETPNLAARLQGLAMPNTLVIGETTRRQIGGLFDLENLGPQQLAG